MLTHASSSDITKKSGSNLALSFICLPEEKRRAMSSFYAYCRIADDIVDEKNKSDELKKQEIEEWRNEIKACYCGTPQSPLGLELQQIIKRYLIPPQPFFDLLDGVAMDVSKNRYHSFEELYRYCYRVASAVGLVSIEIFEFKNPRARKYAEALGMAFQLTNILRDVRVDLEQYNRIYLPQNELDSFGVQETDLLDSGPNPQRENLFRMLHFRATHFFNKAARLLPQEDRKNFIAAELMTEVYYNLLQKIKTRGFSNPEKPIKLNRLEKLWAINKGRKGATINRKNLTLPQTISVFGGGFSGISSALHLALQGHTPHLYEAKAYSGGRAHSFQDSKTGITLDNGQHIFMGCYYSCLELFDILGVQDKLQKQNSIEVPFLLLKPNKSASVLRADPSLPSPLHMLNALINFQAFSWSDRFNIIRFAIRLRLSFEPEENWTVEHWLKNWGQTDNSIRCLWEPFCVAALNEPIATANAKLLYNVLRQSLFADKTASSIYISKVGLSEIFMPETRLFLESIGGGFSLNKSVSKIEFNEQQIESICFKDEETVKTDLYVSALPWNALNSLLPSESPLSQQISNIPSAPIVCAHLLCDCKLLDDSFVGFLDSPVHWIFDRSDQVPADQKNTYLYSIVVSAAYDSLDQKSGEFLEMLWNEIQKFFPQAKSGKILHHFIYKSRDATFASRPEIEKFRPHSPTPWNNFYLAGDWTQTGLPGTLEGAVLSGEVLSKIIDQTQMKN